MRFLVDVNVLCEPTKPTFNAKVVAWLNTHDAEIVVDPVVMGEIWEGIVALPTGKRKTGLVNWFDELRTTVDCLPWTLESAMVWAEVRDEIRRNGFTVAVKDTFIAASARLHGLTVVTRNVNDFRRCGIPVVNPFE
jgi:predicted nucleic acid-binding protein